MSASKGSRNAVSVPLSAIRAPCDASNEPLNAVRGLLFTDNGLLNTVSVSWNASNGSLSGAGASSLADGGTWNTVSVSWNAVNAFRKMGNNALIAVRVERRASRGSLEGDGAGWKRAGEMRRGKREGAYGSTPPRKRIYFAPSGAGVELVVSVAAVGGVSGCSGFFFLIRPRKGCMPNSTSFSLRLP